MSYTKDKFSILQITINKTGSSIDNKIRFLLRSEFLWLTREQF
jgi:hypothetical protein